MRLAIFAAILSFFVVQANAQYIGAQAQAQFGIGLHGGAGVCQSYSGGLPEGLVEIEDEIEEYKKQLRDVKSKIRKVDSKKKSLDRQIEANKKLMCAGTGGVLKTTVCEGVDAHMKLRKEPPQSLYTIESICTDAPEGGPARPWPTFCAEDATDPGNKTEEAIRFHTALNNTESGRVRIEVCDAGTPFVVANTNSTAIKNCQDAVKRLDDLYVEQWGLESKEALEAQKLAIKARIDALRDDKKELISDAREDGTEADYCYSCQYRNDKPISTTEKVGSLLLGGLGAYLGYKGYKYGVDTAADLGYPVAANPAVVMGGIYPSVAMGIYGATGGFGAGGCGAGSPLGIYGPGGLYGTGLYPQGGGAFGYPRGMGGGMGGGMYMGGLGPWGMNGPWGGGGMYPGMGVPMAGGYPMAGGGMFAGGIGGGIGGMFSGGGGFQGGFPFAGGMGGFQGGFPMSGGGMFAGGIGGGIGGMMMGGAPFMGGMGGGAPFMGGMAGGGMFAGGMGGGIPGGIAAPYPFGGGGGFQGGFAGGFQGGFQGGFAGGGGMAGLQYQQQMLQMQQQQTQAWIQSQQRAQQDYYNRQQTVGQLQSQLVQIQMQIQQVQYGVYGSGFSSGGAQVAPYPGQGGQPQYAPYPGSPGYQPGFPGQQQFPTGGGGTSARGGR